MGSVSNLMKHTITPTLARGIMLGLRAELELGGPLPNPLCQMTAESTPPHPLCQIRSAKSTLPNPLRQIHSVKSTLPNPLCQVNSATPPNPLRQIHSATSTLGFEGAQHRQTLRPSVDGVRSKALRPFGSVQMARGECLKGGPQMGL